MTVLEKVEKAIAKARPYIQMDGGDISLVAVNAETGVVEVSLKGACRGCPGSTSTLKGVIEKIVKADVPEIREIRSVGS